MADKIDFDVIDECFDICMDNVFKAIFARETPASQKALSRLVSALIAWRQARATFGGGARHHAFIRGAG
jgi:hypothetical protein